jgi:DNA-binding NarL/FixJ family response regulator
VAPAVGGGATAVDDIPTTRVVIVDDRRWTRQGFADDLATSPQVAVVAALDHRQALTQDIRWDSVDVVVVDAGDERRSRDQFPGVTVVRHVRAQQDPARPPTIVIVTGYYYDDGLRHRMAEAKADLFFLRTEINSAEELVDIVVNPKHYKRPVPRVADTRRRRLLGVTWRSNVETFVEEVNDAKLDKVLEGKQTVSRRALFQVRARLTKNARLDPVNLTTGFGRAGKHQQQASSRPQLFQLWKWSARIKHGPVDPLREQKPPPGITDYDE